MKIPEVGVKQSLTRMDTRKRPLRGSEGWFVHVGILLVETGRKGEKPKISGQATEGLKGGGKIRKTDKGQGKRINARGKDSVRRVNKRS